MLKVGLGGIFHRGARLLTRQGGEQEITNLLGFLQTAGAERAAPAPFGVIRFVKGEMTPPGAVVVPKVMAGITRIHPDSQCGRSHAFTFRLKRTRGWGRKQKATSCIRRRHWIREGYFFEATNASRIDQGCPGRTVAGFNSSEVARPVSRVRGLMVEAV